MMNAEMEKAAIENAAGAAGEVPKTLYLIDGFAQLFRAYHAIRTPMSSPVTKEPTNATFGWVGMLLKVLREYRPDYLAVIIDVSSDQKTFRSDIYPEYKANREPPPLDFRPQVERCFEIARLMNIPVVGVERYEADDVIASVVREMTAASDDLRMRIVSKDKDLEQLLSDRVEMIDVHKDLVTDVAALQEKRGIAPGQVRDMLALMGDTSDNVPGVAGIGPKTAALLLQQYDTIDNLYEHLDELKGKRRENLEKSKDLVALSRTLVTLVEDVESDFDLEASRVDVARLPADELIDLFETLGFHRYPQEVRALVGGGSVDARDKAGKEKAKKKRSVAADEVAPAGSLFAGLEAETASVPGITVIEPKRGKYECITTAAALNDLIVNIRNAGRMAIDTETTALDPIDAKLCGISIALEEGTGVYIPVRSPNASEHLSEAEVLDALRPVLEDAAIGKVGQNLKYDWIIFKNHGVALNGVVGDSMIASYLVDSARSSHGLDNLAQSLLEYRCIPTSQLLGERGKGKVQRIFDTVPLEVATTYAAEDADVALRLVNLLEPQLQKMGLQKLYDDVEIPLVEVLASMEFAGMLVDGEVLESQRGVLAQRIGELRTAILEDAPREFNPDSPKQLAKILFNAVDDLEAPGLGLKVVKRGKTGPSTDLEVLEKLAGDPAATSKVPALIVEYRQLTKLVNTYLVALGEARNKKTGRVHASFNQTVAATGRLSSSDPNLQNIPIRTEVGRQIRKAFVAAPGYQLITADYSQIELRILAHLSEDENLLAAFRTGEDIHRTVAAEVYGVEPSEVTREQRGNAKMVNFGIVYGITAYGLARRLGGEVTNEEAARIIHDYKARFTGIEAFLQRCIAEATANGFVKTMLGRRRAVPQIASLNPRERTLGERVAINSVVQGSAADLIKVAMVNLYRKLPERFPGTRILLQIHDELVLESPIAGNEVQNALAFVVEEMETALELKIPLKVEAEIADNWLESK